MRASGHTAIEVGARHIADLHGFAIGVVPVQRLVGGPLYDRQHQDQERPTANSDVFCPSALRPIRDFGDIHCGSRFPEPPLGRR